MPIEETLEAEVEQLEDLPAVHGIVLAGAAQTGASRFERLGPKATLPLGLEPLVCHVIRWLLAGNVARVTLCTNRASGTDVRRCVRRAAFDDLDLDHVEDWTPRGSAGCVRDAGHGSAADLFVVVEGGIFPLVNIAALVRRHMSTGAIVTVVVHRHEEPRGGDGPGRLSPVGIYVFERRVIGLIPEAGFQGLKVWLVKRLNEAGERILPYEDFAAPRVVCPATLLAANAWMLERMLAELSLPEGFHRLGDALVHHTAHIAPSARFVGPVLVGPCANVLEDAVLVGPTVVGDGATIETSALLARSLLLSRGTIGAGAVVDRTVVGECGVIPKWATADGIVVLSPPPGSLALGPRS